MIRSCRIIQGAIATTKRKTGTDPSEAAETDGPGQIPARLQPTPNITEPATSRPSILIFVATKVRRSACQLIA